MLRAPLLVFAFVTALAGSAPAGELPFEVTVRHGETAEVLDVPVRVETAPERGFGRNVGLEIELPEGLMPADPTQLAPWASVAPDTQSVRATVVLLPAVRVVLRPSRDLRGRVRKATLRLGDRSIPPRGRSPLVFDVPRHAGSRLVATIETAAASGRAVTALRPDADRIVLDVPARDTSGGSVGVSCRGAPGVPSIARDGDATVTLRVLRASGEPAADARIRLDGRTAEDHYVLREAETDADGVAVLRDLPACAARIVVLRAHGLPSVEDVDVRSEGELMVRCAEPVGAPVVVRVVDAAGHPVPCVRVEPRFGRTRLRSVHDGVLDLTPLTDATGTCTLYGMPPRGLTIRVLRGGDEADARPDGSGALVAVFPIRTQD